MEKNFIQIPETPRFFARGRVYPRKKELPPSEVSHQAKKAADNSSLEILGGGDATAYNKTHRQWGQCTKAMEDSCRQKPTERKN